MTNFDGNVFMADAQEVLTELGRRNVKQAALLSMLISMEADYAKGGWDQIPVMIALKGFELDETQYAVVGKEIGALPESACGMGGDGMAAFIRLAAADIAAHVSAEELASVIGMALMSEGWAITIDHMDEVALEKATQAALRHTIDTMPGRHEVRMFTCVDRDGVLYTVQRERDGALRAGITFTPDEDEGQIPEAMRRLMWAVTHARD